MKLYQTDYQGDGRFIGEVTADPNPMREGDWLIPAGAVEIAPPEVEEPSYARWIEGSWEVHTPPPPEPEPELEPEDPQPVTVVSKAQAKLALLEAGLLDDVEAALASMEGVAGQRARIEWNDRTEFHRDHEFIGLLAAAIGLSDADVDALFTQAASL